MKTEVNTDKLNWLSILESTKALKLNLLRPLKITLSHWLMPLTSGLVIILAGILPLVFRFENYGIFSILLGAIILFSGLAEITFALSRSKQLKGWGWFFIGGNIDLLCGLFFIYFPDMTLSMLAPYVAFRLLFKSTMAIGVLSKQQFPYTFPWSSLLLFVAVAKGLALFIFVWSILDGNNNWQTAAFFFVILGFIRIFMALGLKKIHDKIPNN
ncbi:DUF308 domain-containing protein [Arenibacter sp. F26102]|uniref:HdeD family acid-resistance protein n=1 Tax=Arenibacter sp. F26102 TaxID=2926416 RepID=UPI001FF598AA|nr:DUF308 domain-containing protein [Arenibacter sp. F26102]MCK0148297.1 DUF308 domain-containing protein [Arenibacter sp. F26102]